VPHHPLPQKPNTEIDLRISTILSIVAKRRAARYETWLTRADFTTGDRLCLSANRVALSLSVYTRPNFSPSA
jgi:hypothetical protein